MKRYAKKLAVLTVALMAIGFAPGTAQAASGQNIQNGNGLCLDSGAYMDQSVSDQACNLGPYQAWGFQNVGTWNGYQVYQLWNGKHGCLDDPNYDAPTTHACNGGDYQHWALIPYGSSFMLENVHFHNGCIYADYAGVGGVRTGFCDYSSKALWHHL
ncbi:hypothetical protein AB0469_15085 [Streptomyces sp. NPDC093801]|uniref:RICIN domain-containing protein n=1 Tax=Streptomyces sp. NPDC093801 TaxID=3155203 RepID=UPI00344FABDA